LIKEWNTGQMVVYEEMGGGGGEGRDCPRQDNDTPEGSWGGEETGLLKRKKRSERKSEAVGNGVWGSEKTIMKIDGDERLSIK
jgi:hypothetical protein